MRPSVGASERSHLGVHLVLCATLWGSGALSDKANKELVRSICESTRSWLQDSWTSAFYVRAPRSGKWIPLEGKKRGWP